MNDLKEAFIHLALECQVLKFGDFILKSGRKSPYFFNAGLFNNGKALQQLGSFYAKTLINSKMDFDHLFGPAYKGLPLATATAISLANMGINKTVSFNRKEIKDHGEKGQLIGAPLQAKTVIIDDVITAGTAFREAQQFIKQLGGQLTGLIVAFDRCEKNADNQSAINAIEAQGIRTLSIITFFDLIDFLQQNKQTKEAERLLAYQELNK